MCRPFVLRVAVLLCIPLLAPALAEAHPKVGSPESVLPPCYIPTEVDTSGWQTIRWYSGNADEPYIFHIPPGFRRDESVRFEHGGEVWLDGKRRLTQAYRYGSYSCVPDGRNPGCSECTTPIGDGPTLRIDTSYEPNDSLYRVTANCPADGSGPMGIFSMLTGESPDSGDQRLFLAVIRTIEKASTLTRYGALSGRVTHQDGTAAPNTSVQSGGRIKVTTDGSGAYSVPQVETGEYLLEAGAAGLVPGRAIARVDPARTTRVDLKLGPAKPADHASGMVSGPAAPSGAILGRVVDQNGRPVSYASVLIKGTQIGAATSREGEFRIVRVPVAAYTLVARSVGYPPASDSVTVVADSTVVANFTLHEVDLKNDSPARPRSYSVDPDSALHLTIRSVLGQKLYRHKVGWPPPIEISIRNEGPDTLVLVDPEPEGLRTAIIQWEAWDSNGSPVPSLPVIWLGASLRGLEQRDVIELLPGQVWKFTWTFPADEFKFKTGHYRVAFTYENRPGMRFGGMLHSPNDPEAVKRLRGSTPCKLTSAPLDIEIK
jgi:hypothetical protein